MGFVNIQVDMTDLPVADELVMEPMAPAYEREVKTQQLIIWLPLLIISFVPFLLGQFIFLLLVPVVMLLLATIISRLVIKKSF